MGKTRAVFEDANAKRHAQRFVNLALNCKQSPKWSSFPSALYQGRAQFRENHEPASRIEHSELDG
jgi:hypothetical protein